VTVICGVDSLPELFGVAERRGDDVEVYRSVVAFLGCED